MNIFSLLINRKEGFNIDSLKRFLKVILILFSLKINITKKELQRIKEAKLGRMMLKYEHKLVMVVI